MKHQLTLRTLIHYNSSTLLHNLKRIDSNLPYLQKCFLSSYTMKAWTVARNSSALKLEKLKQPTISCPNDVLVEVCATSINPLDVLMRNGYGRAVFDSLDFFTNFDSRITSDRYPLTLGRDFSGRIVAVGGSVDKFKPGDEVFGCIEPHKNGSHADMAIASSSLVAKKPKNLTHTQAASIPYAGLTAWSALCTFGCIKPQNCLGKQVLVLGGSGGVGSISIQLLKLWGANVTATCSSEKVDWLLNELFVDEAICYEDEEQLSSLIEKFDFVLDAGSYGNSEHQKNVERGLKYLRPYRTSTYVTLSPPLLKKIDQFGIIQGTFKAAFQAGVDTLTGLRNINQTRWAFFTPNNLALESLALMLKDESIRPMIWKEFSMSEIEKAYEEYKSGSVMGKILVVNDNS